jgi:hypothetical protein
MDDLRARFGQPEKDPRLNTRPPRWGVIVVTALIILVLIVLVVGSYLTRKPASVPAASSQAASASTTTSSLPPPLMDAELNIIRNPHVGQVIDGLTIISIGPFNKDYNVPLSQNISIAFNGTTTIQGDVQYVDSPIGSAGDCFSSPDLPRFFGGNNTSSTLAASLCFTNDAAAQQRILGTSSGTATVTISNYTLNIYPADTGINTALLLSGSMSAVEETNIGVATTTHGLAENTYANSTYNFQIQYPSFMQEVPAVSSTVPFVPVCSDGDILCLEYPSEHLPDVVNFEGAALAVDVYSGYHSAASCDDLSDSTDGSVTTTIINGNLFTTGISSDGATGHSLNGVVYRTYHNASCYAIYFGVGTYRCDSGDATVDANNNLTSCDGHPTANVPQTEQQMRAVVSSFKFL